MYTSEHVNIIYPKNIKGQNLNFNTRYKTQSAHRMPIHTTQERTNKYPSGLNQRRRPVFRPASLGNRRLFRNRHQTSYYNNRQQNYGTTPRYERWLPLQNSIVKIASPPFRRPESSKIPQAGKIKLNPLETGNGWMNLPRATVYPGGKCKLSRNNTKEAIRIGYCRSVLSPCNIGEESPEVCGNFFKCCVPSGNYTAAPLKSQEQKASTIKIEKPLPLATVYPRGMCQISNEDGIRVGSCMPDYLVCQLAQHSTSTTTTAQNNLEAVAVCRRMHPFQPHMLCCAPKIANLGRLGQSFVHNITSNSSENVDIKSVNGTKLPEKSGLPTIVLY